MLLGSTASDPMIFTWILELKCPRCIVVFTIPSLAFPEIRNEREVHLAGDWGKGIPNANIPGLQKVLEFTLVQISGRGVIFYKLVCPFLLSVGCAPKESRRTRLQCFVACYMSVSAIKRMSHMTRVSNIA